jgi:hypothetical protein
LRRPWSGMECCSGSGPSTSTAMSIGPYRRRTLRAPTTPARSRPNGRISPTLATMTWRVGTQVSMLLTASTAAPVSPPWLSAHLKASADAGDASTHPQQCSHPTSYLRSAITTGSSRSHARRPTTAFANGGGRIFLREPLCSSVRAVPFGTFSCQPVSEPPTRRRRVTPNNRSRERAVSK